MMNNLLNKFVHNFRLVAVLTELKMFEENKQGFATKQDTKQKCASASFFRGISTLYFESLLRLN